MKRTLKLALLAAVALTAFGLVASPVAAEDDNTCMGGHFQFCEQSMDAQPMEDSPCMGGHFEFCAQSMDTQPLDDNPCLGDQWNFCS